MRPTRRDFLRAGAFGAVAMLGGCEDAKDLLAEYLAPEDPRNLKPPGGDAIDLPTHVLNRLTFGPRPGEHHRIASMGVDAFIEEQLAPASIDDRRCGWKTAELERINQPRAELYNEDPRLLLHELTRDRLLRAVYSKRQLQEVMVDFWSDHFNIAVNKGDCRWMHVADEREVVRPHALGNFRDLVKASALSPAMLVYLDGHDNKVVHPGDRPNENYARELLELHTLGVHGGYTQQDVMEAARCLSGWTYGHKPLRLLVSVVEFDAARHDDGEKMVLGARIAPGGGAKDLDDVIDLACRHPSTARHIASKLCRLFIADPPPPGAVDQAATTFGRTGGDIREVLRAIFASEAFRSHRGGLFKRPQRFVVSALRAVGARTDAGEAVQRYLERMGHAPFGYPTPDGYPLHMTPWLGTLLWRWKFVLDLAGDRLAGTSADFNGLTAEMGGADAAAAHVLGRSPTALERQALGATSQPVALALAGPAFQWH
jgi:uncharacterized protein (DUF1800 family)